MAKLKPVELCASALLCILIASCASERMVAQSGRTPAWTAQPPAEAADALLFVGQAVGRNVLDERSMRTRALEDARNQIAGLLETKVVGETREHIHRRGDAPRGSREVSEVEYTRLMRTSVEQNIRGVSQKANYWEKWRIDPGLFSRSFIRYKYYVLAAYSSVEYERSLRHFTRLAVERERAHELIDRGQPLEAAHLLEELLNDYPGAPVPIRLTLADAYEDAGMIDLAEAALEATLELTEEPAELVRIRERIDRLRAVFPDLSGRSAYVLFESAGAGNVSLDVARPWIEEACALSRLDVAAVEAGAMGGPSHEPVRSARESGADWLIALRMRVIPARDRIEPYEVEAYEVHVECSARVFSTSNGKLLTSASITQRGLGRDRGSAERSARMNAVRDALRQCFLSLSRLESNP